MTPGPRRVDDGDDFQSFPMPPVSPPNEDEFDSEPEPEPLQRPIYLNEVPVAQGVRNNPAPPMLYFPRGGMFNPAELTTADVRLPMIGESVRTELRRDLFVETDGLTIPAGTPVMAAITGIAAMRWIQTSQNRGFPIFLVEAGQLLWIRATALRTPSNLAVITWEPYAELPS